MKYTLPQKTVQFEDIVVLIKYKNNAPFFETIPRLPSDIPCLTNKEALSWFYNLPNVRDTESDQFYIDLELADLQEFIIFSDSDSALYLDINGELP